MEGALKLVPLLAILVALCGLIYQMCRAHFNLEVDIALKLTGRLDAHEMKSMRAASEVERDDDRVAVAADRHVLAAE